MRERFTSLFGSLAIYFMQLLLIGMILIPLNYLSFPWWVDAIICIFIFIFRVLGGFACIIIWIWSFVIFVQSPFNAYSIIYLVFLILYVSLFLVPHLIKKKN